MTSSLHAHILFGKSLCTFTEVTIRQLFNCNSFAQSKETTCSFTTKDCMHKYKQQMLTKPCTVVCTIPFQFWMSVYAQETRKYCLHRCPDDAEQANLCHHPTITLQSLVTVAV